jgi:predicted MFS family arabinose efflux permease
VFALITAVPLFLMTVLPHGSWIGLVLVVTTVMFITTSGRMVPGMAMITASAAPRHRGSFLSVNTSVSHMAMGLASIAAGLILGDTEGGAPLANFWIVGLLGAAASIVTALLGGWLRPAMGGLDAVASVQGLSTALSTEEDEPTAEREAPPDAIPA